MTRKDFRRYLSSWVFLFALFAVVEGSSTRLPVKHQHGISAGAESTEMEEIVFIHLNAEISSFLLCDVNPVTFDFV